MSAPAPSALDQVYEALTKLSEAKENAGNEKKAFELLLDSVKGDNKVKQLVAPYISRYFKFFPDFHERALNAQIDLCEDADLAVRVNVIRSLGDLCKGSPVHTQRIGDVLGQLLVADDHTELQTVKTTLSQLFDIDARASIAALLTQVVNGDEAGRAKTIAYFKEKFETKEVKAKLSDAELQKDVAANIKKILAHPSGVTADEFKYFLSVLQSFKVVREDPAFKGEIAAIIVKQANLDSNFDPANEEFANTFVSCLKTAQPLFRARGPKKGADEKAVVAGPDNSQFLDFFFSKILPVLDAMPEKSRLNVLRAIVDASRDLKAEHGAKVLDSVLATIKKYVPAAAPAKPAAAAAPAAAPAAAAAAPAPEAGAAPAAPAAAAPAPAAASSDINWFNVECLLYILQEIAFKNAGLMRNAIGVFVPSGQPTDFLTPDVAAKKADLFARFNYLIAAAKTYSQQCKTAGDRLTALIKDEKDEAKKKEHFEKRVAVNMANRSVQNSVALVQGFMAKVPAFGTKDVNLSWKQGQKRKADKKPNAGGAGAGGKDEKKGDRKHDEKSGRAAKRVKGNDGKSREKTPEPKKINKQQHQQQQQQQQKGGNKGGNKGGQQQQKKGGGNQQKGGQQKGGNNNNNNNQRGRQQQQQQKGGGKQQQQQQQQSGRARSGSRKRR